jgi:hypothetical protein
MLGVREPTWLLYLDDLALHDATPTGLWLRPESKAVTYPRLEVVRHEPLGKRCAVGEGSPYPTYRMRIDDFMKDGVSAHSASLRCSPKASSFSPQNRSYFRNQSLTSRSWAADSR